MKKCLHQAGERLAHFLDQKSYHVNIIDLLHHFIELFRTW
eukprot:Gb_22985 [translate_table: standard]